MIGYFEECNDDSKHYGVFNLVIMNFGQSIYEKFKYPIDEVKLNTECLSRMQELRMLLLRNVGLGLQSSLKKLYGHCIPYNKGN